MAWYTDEQYMMIQDSREKKSIAASAFKQKTHCGKSGRVKFPSDYMTAKELKSMNGECKSYRMNDPMSWSEFVEWPNEHKIAYIRKVRDKFGVDDKHIAEMFGVACNLFLMYVKELGLDTKCECDENWSREKFYAWRTGGRTELVEENTVGDVEVEPAKEPDLTKPMKWDEFKTLTDEQKITYIQGIRNQFGATDGFIADMLGIDRSWLTKMVISKLNLGRGRGAGHGKWDKEGFMKWAKMEVNETVTEEPEIVSVPLVEEVGEERAEITESINITSKVVVGEEDVYVDIKDWTRSVVAAEKPQKAVEQDNDIPETKDTSPAKPACELAEDCEKKRIHDAGPIAFMGNPMPVIPKKGSMTFENNTAEDVLTTIKSLLGIARVNLTISWECLFEDTENGLRTQI